MTTPLISIAICVFVLAGVALGVFVVRDLVRSRRQRSASAAPAESLTTMPAPFAAQSSASQRLPYVRTPHLLTDAEQTFFAVLQSVVPSGFVVYPQMRLASIVQVEAWARNNHTHFNRVQAKCVDFVLCEAQTTAPRLVIELDDSSHNRRDRKERDAFVDAALASAGIPILHVRWQRSYDAQHIARSVQTLLDIKQLPNAPRTLPHASTCSACQGEIAHTAKHCPYCGVKVV